MKHTTAQKVIKGTTIGGLAICAAFAAWSRMSSAEETHSHNDATPAAPAETPVLEGKRISYTEDAPAWKSVKSDSLTF